MNKPSMFPKQKSATRAFSLVEVTLALGIVGFGMVSVMGLLPVGLTTFRDAMDRSVSAQIVQAVLNEYQLVDFTNLPTAPVTTYYSEEGRTSDEGGVSVTESTAKYRVEVSFEAAELPGGVTNPDMRRARVSIMDQPSGRELKKYSSMMVKRTK